MNVVVPTRIPRWPEDPPGFAPQTLTKGQGSGGRRKPPCVTWFPNDHEDHDHDDFGKRFCGVEIGITSTSAI